MELDQVLKGRRTIRKFDKKEVPIEFISECLDTARYAPNSGNVQNYRFTIIRNKDIITKISKICEGQEWIAKAPVLVIVCSEMEQIKRLYGIRGEALYSIQNCAVAIQNILLKAYELKLGSAWIGTFDEEKLKILINIPETSRPQAVIAFGYYDEKDIEELEKEPLDNFVYFEQYGKREDKTLKILPFSNTIKRITGKIGDKISYKKKS